MKTKTRPKDILIKKVSADMEKKHYANFAKQAKFMGNGFYYVPELNINSTCTRELFLMYVAVHEGIEY